MPPPRQGKPKQRKPAPIRITNLYDPSAKAVIVPAGRSGAMPNDRRPAKSAKPLSRYGGDYGEYLRSKHWRETRNRYRRHRPWICICGAQTALHLHHKTYKRLGAEELDDLHPLCQECHSLIHLLRDRGLIPDLDPIHLIERTPEPSLEAWVSIQPKLANAQKKQRTQAEKRKAKKLARKQRRQNRHRKPKLSRSAAEKLALKQQYRKERDLASSQSRPLL